MAAVKGITDEKLIKSYEKNKGNIRAMARELGCTRQPIRTRLKKLGKYKKPLVGGKVEGNIKKVVAPLPSGGRIKRYILTSAQNNTHVHEKVWESLKALADYYHAEIIVGTFSYNQNAYGKLATKRGTTTQDQGNRELWYDPAIEPYINDHSVQLGKGLVWCGEMNILPTQDNPLAGLESYSQRKSAIFPNAKMAMRSIPTMQGEGTKLNYTTGAVTKRNYIQKRVGIIAEHHHVYGGLIVEVNENGNWWVRQLNADQSGAIYDLDLMSWNGRVTKGHHVEAITWGDLHGAMVDPAIVAESQDMLDFLKPKYQFLHDVFEGVSFNRHLLKHGVKNFPHQTFHRWIRGLHKVDAEFKVTAEVIQRYLRPWCKTIAPDSNHDAWWLCSWLGRHDYRVDPANAELFLKLQSRYFQEIRDGKMPRDVNVMQFSFEMFGIKDVKFLLADESFKICNDKIECGMHGHLGPNGKYGRPEDLAKMGRKANTAHTHAAGIYHGLYVAGTSSSLKWDYAFGPSSWSHSHIVTYANGKRAIVTMYAGAWRA